MSHQYLFELELLLLFSHSVCPTLCEPMDCSTPVFPLLHHIMELAQTRVLWVNDAIQQSCPLSSPSPPAFSLSQVFSNESTPHIRRTKYWSFSFSISPSNEYSGFLLGLTDLIFLQPKGLSRVLFYKPQFKSINSIEFSLLYGPTLTSIRDYWKTIDFTIWTFVGKVMSLLFNMLSRFVITFLPRSKKLLISWQQSPSAVILVV